LFKPLLLFFKAIVIVSRLAFLVMAVERSGYKKISIGDSEEKVNGFSLLFFQWMNDVIKIGSKRALEDTDVLPISK